MGEKVILKLPHIRLIENEEMEIILIVEDTELNDYIDDFLWDEYELDEYGTEFYEINKKTESL
jgi:hypothetical protein